MGGSFGGEGNGRERESLIMHVSFLDPLQGKEDIDHLR